MLSCSRAAVGAEASWQRPLTAPPDGVSRLVAVAGSLVPALPVSTWPAKRRTYAGSVVEVTVMSYQWLPAGTPHPGTLRVAPAPTVYA